MKLFKVKDTNGMTFSVCLNKLEQSGGVLIMGGIDTALYEDPI